MAQRRSIFTETIEEGLVIQGEVYYSKGGANYFSGGNDPRGYWFSVQPVRIKDGMRSFMMGSGHRKFLKEAKRFSDKELAAVMPDEALIENMKALGKAAAEKDRALLMR